MLHAFRTCFGKTFQTENIRCRMPSEASIIMSFFRNFAMYRGAWVNRSTVLSDGNGTNRRARAGLRINRLTEKFILCSTIEWDHLKDEQISGLNDYLWNSYPGSTVHTAHTLKCTVQHFCSHFLLYDVAD